MGCWSLTALAASSGCAAIWVPVASPAWAVGFAALNPPRRRRLVLPGFMQRWGKLSPVAAWTAAAVAGRIARIGAVIVFLCAAGVHAAALPDPVRRIVNAHALPESSLGIFVQKIGDEAPVVSLNPEIPRNPASTIKILTTLAALEELGPTYQWPTEVYRLGTMRGSRLDGDLLLKGYGDPYLVTEEYWKLVQTLRRQGLEHIDGDLVVDNNFFTIPEQDPGAFDRRPYHVYNVLPDALLVNFKAVYFHFHAGPGSSRVGIQTEPELANLTIDNRLTAVDGPCQGYQRGIAMTIPDPARGDRVVFEGQFPRSCRYYLMSRSVLTPPAYAYGLFRTLWEQSGGSISGGMRTGTAPAGARPVLVWRSRTLAEVIRLVNKHSNNVMTRQLLLTLGAELHGEPGTIDSGIAAINEYLVRRGIDNRSLVLENGSGLSRDERASPRLLADVLLRGSSISFMPEYISSFAILGMDGTARNRLRRRSEAGQAHVKTGTIDHVSAIAGYVRARSGQRYVVVGMANHKDVHHGAGERLWNALIQWTYAQ
jgi:D-alanyl-D-alanine carboxypeptidase/D-alanyl-D-alanine-endopeptidase (penicillin-binding protein 4)